MYCCDIGFNQSIVSPLPVGEISSFSPLSDILLNWIEFIRSNLATSVITSVVHYRTANTNNSNNNNKRKGDWCVLSLAATDNMNSPECNKASKIKFCSSSSTSMSSSLDSLTHCDDNDNIVPNNHFKLRKPIGNRQSPISSIDSTWRQIDIMSNLIIIICILAWDQGPAGERCKPYVVNIHQKYQ